TWCACEVVPRIAEPPRDLRTQISEVQLWGCLLWVWGRRDPRLNGRAAYVVSFSNDGLVPHGRHGTRAWRDARADSAPPCQLRQIESVPMTLYPVSTTAI